MMATKTLPSKHITGIECKLCGEQIYLDPADNSTYLSKTKHEKFFGNQLFTYRVAHIASNTERHVNTLLIDQKGLFRGYIDVYAEKIKLQRTETEIEIETVDFTNFLFLGQEIDSREPNAWFNLFIFLDLAEEWVIDLVKPKNMRLLEILRFIHKRIKESKQLYKSLPFPLKVEIANLKVNLWIQDTKVLALSVKNQVAVERFQPLAKVLLDYFSINHDLPRKRAFLLMISLLELKDLKISATDLEHILRIIDSDLIYSTMAIRYPDKTSLIIQRLKKRFTFIPENALRQLLEGKKSIIDIIETDEYHLKNYLELIRIVDFINRRKLISRYG